MTAHWPALAAGDGPAVLAVGTAGGVTSGFDGLPDGGGLVRLGGELLSLDREEYRLWDACMLVPTREALLRQARKSRVPEPEGLLRQLFDAYLVVEFDSDPRTIERHAYDLAARFTGRFTGNGPHRSDRFLISTGTAGPFWAADVVLYEFLLQADGTTCIAQQCTRLGAGRLPPGFSSIRHVVEWLPALLRVGLVNLDRAVGARPQVVS